MGFFVNEFFHGKWVLWMISYRIYIHSLVKVFVLFFFKFVYYDLYVKRFDEDEAEWIIQHLDWVYSSQWSEPHYFWICISGLFSSFMLFQYVFITAKYRRFSVFFLFLCCIFHPSNDENRILGHLPTQLFIAVDEKNLLVSDDVDE